MPLLLTCEHCVDLSKMSTKTVTAYNHIGAARIELHEIEELQAPRDHSGKRNCIDIDSEMCLIDSEFDVALIPLRNFHGGSIPGYEVDLDKIANKEELGKCFQEKQEAVISALLTPTNFTRISGISQAQPRKEHIRKDTCRNLSWDEVISERDAETLITHDCPTANGFSGSLLTLSCEGKQGLFIH